MKAFKRISWTQKNSKTNKPHKFVLIFSQKLDWRGSSKYVALKNVSTYYKKHKIKKL